MPMTPSAHRWSVLCLFLVVWLTSATDPTTERGILEIFYNECNGDNWNDRTNWLDAQSICNWTGVECPFDVEQVERLRLPNNNITCSLPNVLFTLPELVWLDLRSNGGISADFTGLNEMTVASLEYLVLSDTNVGSLDGIEVFSDSLTTLYMSGCELSGPIPENVFLLSALKNLDLSYNFLSGVISDRMNALPDLRSIILSHNFFNGQIPSTIGSLQRLTNVQMQFNGLSGTLPQQMGEMFSLSFLTLNNQIQGVGDSQVGGIAGPLLDFATLQFLFHVDLSSNRLSGTVPPSFLASLLPGFDFSTLVDLRSNQLRGEVPASLAKFDNILAYLADNQIESVAPELCQESDWLFGQVGQFGCNALLCPPGTFNPFGRQFSDGFPCWQCRTGETAPYFGSKSCVADSSLAARMDTHDVETLVHVNSPFERLSKDAAVPFSDVSGTNDYDGNYWRDGLEHEADDALVVQSRSAVSSGRRAVAAMGTLATLAALFALL